MTAIYGIELNTYNRAINLLDALPLNEQSSVEDETSKRNRSSKLSSVMTTSQKYPSHIVQALQHLVGYASFQVSQNAGSIYFKQKSVDNMETKVDNGETLTPDENDKKLRFESEIKACKDLASQWLDLHDVLIDKLVSQLESEDLNTELHPIVPFPVDEAKIKKSLTEIGEESQFEEAVKVKTQERNDVIKIIESIKSAECGPSVYFVSLAKLLEKLDTYSDKQAELKKTWAISAETIAKSAQVKKVAIDLVADKLNEIIENESYLIEDNKVKQAA